MSVELSMLLSTAGLLLGLTLTQRARDFLFPPLIVTVMDHPDLQHSQLWYARLDHAISTLIEAIAIFAPLVLVVHSLGFTNSQTEFGAQLFFAARVCHVIFSLSGALFPRIGASFAGVMGMLIIASGIIH